MIAKPKLHIRQISCLIKSEHTTTICVYHFHRYMEDGKAVAYSPWIRLDRVSKAPHLLRWQLDNEGKRSLLDGDMLCSNPENTNGKLEKPEVSDNSNNDTF